MDIGDWLRTLGLQQYETIFRENDIDAEVLSTLGADDLRELGISSLGHRKKLLAAIAALVNGSSAPTTTEACQKRRRPHPPPSGGSSRSCFVTWWVRRLSRRSSIPRTCGR